VKYLKQVQGRMDLSDDKWAEVMVNEALEQVNILEQLNFKNVVVSLKSDNFKRTVLANELFAKQSDIPLHIGLTEAGSFLSGTVKSAVALGTLLQKGIGATIRVSLTEDPRLQVRTAYEILKALNLREYGPNLISCPTCGRTQVDVTGTVHALEEKIYNSRALREKATGLKIAVMGCVVSGPGEARDADFGIAGGKGEGLYFEHGQTMFKLPQEKWVDFLIDKINTWKK
ncbi:MAG: flavodoxin-dependent (E)-4-hydroxy-3-methylbut-2-enyl-diphosphate synthase, partial [Elusimicrobiaceae bacterium]|nr:flavodoxin-dependent (E)-4-hydroxy-3-methylbut-2-enyl-diphosphate synthase [Elusimicrobiaceae bacterium]